MLIKLQTFLMYVMSLMSFALIYKSSAHSQIEAKSQNPQLFITFRRNDLGQYHQTHPRGKFMFHDSPRKSIKGILSYKWNFIFHIELIIHFQHHLRSLFFSTLREALSTLHSNQFLPFGQLFMIKT